MKRFICLLVLLLCAGLAEAATRYVDNAASMTADCTTGNYHVTNRNCTGSAGNAYRSPHTAASNLAPGDIVEMRSGTYADIGSNFTINCQTTTCDFGTVGNVITWRTYNVETVIFSGAVNLFNANASVYWTFQDLIVDQNGDQGHCFNLSGNTFTSSPKHVRVEGGECRNTGDHGFIMRGEDFVISGVTITNSGEPTDTTATHAIYVTQQSLNLVIEKNVISDSGTYGIHIYDSSDTGLSNGIIRYNRITNVPNATNFSQGGIVIAGDGWQVYSNLIYDFVASDVSTFGIEVRYNTPSTNRIYNNTILMPAAGTGIYIDAAASNTIIQNNIVMGGAARITNSGSDTICSTNLTSDSATSPCVGAIDTAANTWTNSAADDFTLKEGSKAIGTGVELCSTFTLDINGASRDCSDPSDQRSWDLGAIKGPLIATLTLINPNGGTLGQTGSTQTFTWTRTDQASVPNVKLLYDAANDGTFEITLIASTTNDGSFNFTAPAITTTGRFRVEDAADGNPFDVSDSNVTITALGGGSITVIISDNTSGPKIGNITNTTNALMGQTSPDFNYGADSGVRANKYAANQHTHSVLKFPTSSIPSAATVTAAELGLYRIAGSGSIAIDFRNNKQVFDQSQTTWNIYSTGNSWSTPGGLGVADRDLTVLCTMAVDADLEYKTCSSANLTAWVQSLVNLSTSNNGAHLERNGTGNDTLLATFASNTGDSDKRPYLQITYTTGTSTLTLTSPTAEDHWFPNQVVPIRWESQGISGDVKAELSYDGGASYAATPIVPSHGFNQGDATWTVAGRGCTQCIVKLTSLNDPGVVSLSPLFKIAGSKLGVRR